MPRLVRSRSRRCLPSSQSSRGVTELTLMQEESSNFFIENCQPIATVTHFRGKPPTHAIKARVASIIRANPWLAGSVSWNAERTRVLLRYEESAEGVDIERFFMEMPPGTPQIYSGMPPEELCISLEGCPAVVMKSKDCLASTSSSSASLFKVAVVPDSKSPSEGFALVVSMSHLLGDGYSYYKLFNMLSDAGEVSALRPQRKEEHVRELETVIGGVPKVGGPSIEKRIAFSLNFVRTALLTRMTIGMYHVDEASMKEAKSRAHSEGVDFLSSNDILATAFVRMVGADVLLVPADMRGRLPCLEQKDAGNYSSILSFAGEKASKASGIRQSLARNLASYTRGDDLGVFRILTSRIVAVTNWSSFARCLVLDACEHRFHQPVFDIKNLPFQGGIIFRSNPGKLSMMLVTDNTENYSASMFGQAIRA